MKRLFSRGTARAWIIAGIVAAVLVLGAGGVYAYTQFVAPRLAQGAYGPPTANHGNSQPTGQHATGKHKAAANGGGATTQLQRLFASSIRGQVTVPDASGPGGYAVVAWAKGNITSVDSTGGQLTIQEPDGTSATFAVPSTARVTVGGAQGTLATLQQGTTVLIVTRQLQGGTPTVMAIVSQSGAASSSGSPAGGAATPTPGNT
jgi:hypothetical protein